MRRRSFIKMLGIGSVATATLPATAEAVQYTYKGSPDAVGVLHDSVRCIGCRKCEEGCQKVNSDILPLPEKPFSDMSVLDETRRPTFKAYTVVNRYKPNGHRPTFRKLQCNHCQEPACASACFVKAFKKTEKGPVVYDSSLCVGCRYCMMACPFYVPAYDYNNALNPLVYKCTMCAPRIEKGLLPGCVDACPKEALIFGKRSDLLNIARKRILDNPESYENHIYGEHEMGGTNWLYLSPVPHKQLGQPDVPEVSAPALTQGMLGSLAVIVGMWPVLLGGIYSMSKHYKKQIQKAMNGGAKHSSATINAPSPCDKKADSNQGGNQC